MVSRLGGAPKRTGGSGRLQHKTPERDILHSWDAGVRWAGIYNIRYTIYARIGARHVNRISYIVNSAASPVSHQGLSARFARSASRARRYSTLFGSSPT